MRRRGLSPLHSNSAHTSPAGSIAQSCLSTSWEGKHRVEVRLMPACAAFVTWANPAGCNVASWMFPTSVQKLLNDWRTVGLAEPQCGGEDLKLFVLNNAMSCSVAPHDKAFELCVSRAKLKESFCYVLSLFCFWLGFCHFTVGIWDATHRFTEV